MNKHVHIPPQILYAHMYMYTYKKYPHIEYSYMRMYFVLFYSIMNYHVWLYWWHWVPGDDLFIQSRVSHMTKVCIGWLPLTSGLHVVSFTTSPSHHHPVYTYWPLATSMREETHRPLNVMCHDEHFLTNPCPPRLPRHVYSQLPTQYADYRFT